MIELLEVATLMSMVHYGSEVERIAALEERVEANVVAFHQGAVDAYSYYKEGEFTILFQGSQTVQDWVVNLNYAFEDSTFLGWPVRLHRGFKHEFAKRVETLDFVKFGLGYKEGDSINIVGHSNGSAFATLFAAHISERSNSPIKLTTFGSPCVGNEEFAYQFESTNVKTIRVQNASDVVTYINRALPRQNAKHVGELYYIDTANYLHVDPDPRFVRWDLTKHRFRKNPLFAHFPFVYVKAIKEALEKKSPEE